MKPLARKLEPEPDDNLNDLDSDENAHLDDEDPRDRSEAHSRFARPRGSGRVSRTIHPSSEARAPQRERPRRSGVLPMSAATINRARTSEHSPACLSSSN